MIYSICMGAWGKMSVIHVYALKNNANTQDLFHISFGVLIDLKVRNTWDLSYTGD